MNALPTNWFPAVLAIVVAVSPLLASWTATLETGGTWRWWQPECVTPIRWLTVGIFEVALSLAAVGAGDPWLAWTAFAVGGGVLMLVDARTHLLPARFLYPLASIIGTVLVVTAALNRDVPALVRAAIAAATVAAAWSALALFVPSAIGLGDVRLFSLCAALLGWVSWPAVIAGQLFTFLLAPAVAVTSTVVWRKRKTAPARNLRDVKVPMGPSAILATVLVGWLING